MNGKISVEFSTHNQDDEDKTIRAIRAAYRALPMINKYTTFIEAVKISFSYSGESQHNGKSYGDEGPEFIFYCKDSANTQFRCEVSWKSTGSWSSDPSVEDMVQELCKQVSASIEKHLERAIERLGGKFVRNKST